MSLTQNTGINDEKRCLSIKSPAFILLLCFLSMVLQVMAQSLIDHAMLVRLQKNHGQAAYQRGLSLKQLMQDLKQDTEQHQLTEINRFFNQFSYIEDLEQWQQRDYWATPEEFLGTNAGDCEDYVIAKYFALRALGFNEKKLYLTYVKSTSLNVAHMVLTYFKTPQSVPLVLDNYDVRILPASQRKDLLPVYSFNAKSLFLTNSSAGLGQKLPNGKVKNSKWTNLLNNIGDIH